MSRYMNKVEKHCCRICNFAESRRSRT